ncbi:MAG TPA: class I SAM-dependent methyltransferase [Pirellulales bacterium]|nr:class I SAM-dependent methyltransferase [Pirellulales bacterium]
MNQVTRLAALGAESLVYGPQFGYLNYLIRSPQPLDPDATWQLITGARHPLGVWIADRYPPSFLRRVLLVLKQRQDHLLGISAHYDVSNDFYELFLDRRYMFYSCADFYTGRETIEEAQQQKADFILKLLDPKPGERILELGCGWGPMLKRIYEATGDKEHLTGYTLSREQVKYNEEHNGFHVEFKNFITADYPTEAFDKIYSIGAWEHVRPREVPMLLAKLYAALVPGGRLVQHFFCRQQENLPAAAVVSQLFFPGSINSSFRYHLRAHEGAGFRVRHVSVHDYRPTLRAWFDNLVKNREQAIELVGVKTYNRYLVFFPASWHYFDRMTGFVIRLILEKPGPTQ